MSSGLWAILIIPAILAFIFGMWVLYYMIIDVSEREESLFQQVGPDTVRMKILTEEEQEKLLKEQN